MFFTRSDARVLRCYRIIDWFVCQVEKLAVAYRQPLRNRSQRLCQTVVCVLMVGNPNEPLSSVVECECCINSRRRV